MTSSNRRQNYTEQGERFPGVDSNLQIIKELQKGYRMERPEYAPNSFGEIMNCCWKTDPNERPTFSQLEEMITNHLESTVSSYYCNLNDSYEKLNEEVESAVSFGVAKLLDVDVTKPKPKLSKSNSLPHKNKLNVTSVEMSNRVMSLRVDPISKR